MSQRHLSIESRETLERCLALGFSLRRIGKIIGYSAAALCKELKRNSIDGNYLAESAHQRAKNRRKRIAHFKKRLSPALEAYIFEKMQLYWSPEQVCGRLKLDFPNDPTMRISFKTIYRRIARGIKKQNYWRSLFHFLRHKRSRKAYKNHGLRSQGKVAATLPSIDTRPAIVAAKSRFGDWESDLICGPIGKGNIATFVERTTGFVLAAECQQKTPAEYKKVALSLFKNVNKEWVRTVTVDRGTEFFAYKDLESELGTKYYFCHPRCPNERGLNEQVNGLLRQFFPKRKTLIGVQTELVKAVNLINHRPRKTLDYKTPMEAVKACGINPNELLTF